jgi:hypothetical protein
MGGRATLRTPGRVCLSNGPSRATLGSKGGPAMENDHQGEAERRAEEAAQRAEEAERRAEEAAQRAEEAEYKVEEAGQGWGGDQAWGPDDGEKD